MHAALSYQLYYEYEKDIILGCTSNVLAIISSSLCYI